MKEKGKSKNTINMIIGLLFFVGYVIYYGLMLHEPWLETCVMGFVFAVMVSVSYKVLLIFILLFGWGLCA